jgi:WhiB family redox-sensing transcriptional regulator
VQAPCLEYALRNRIDHGVWGGASERERRRILRQRRLQAQSKARRA